MNLKGQKRFCKASKKISTKITKIDSELSCNSKESEYQAESL